jgi:hypothetical protein
VTVVLALLFLLSASMNLGAHIPVGFAVMSFQHPSSSIAAFESLIAAVLLASALLSNLYVYGGAYLLTAVGIAEGLLSSAVQGLARELHEAMIPFLVVGWVLVIVEARTAYAGGKTEPGRRKRNVIASLQFFVGGLVTLGGAAYASSGTYPFGTLLGSIHLVIGLTGLLGGYFFLRRRGWSGRFLVTINLVTIVYSAFSESVAQVYALLPPGINDSLIGTVIAIIVAAVIVYALVRDKQLSQA